MTGILKVFTNWVSLVPRFSLLNLIEIIIIAVLVYECLLWIKNTRAWTLLKGIMVILLFTMLAALFNLDTILWILEKVSTIAVIALVIIFQPELRKALEQIGSQKLFGGLHIISDKHSGELDMESISKITSAVYDMARVKTGALIVIEREVNLDEFINTGIALDALISSGLIVNIFEKNTPLHDGAVIIRGDRIVAATCYLPLSDNLTINKHYGTRHRAGLGISDVSDSVTIIVSEETGNVSLAQNGVLTGMRDSDQLETALMELACTHEKTSNPLFGKLKNVSNNEERNGEA